MAAAAAALQVNPSSMTRDSQGFASTAKLPSSCDLSLRRHQVTPVVFKHGVDAVTSSAMKAARSPADALNLSPYATTYDRTHQMRYSAGYDTMENHARDQPSGATHNTVAPAQTSVWAKDTYAAARTANAAKAGSARVLEEADAGTANPDGRVGFITDPMGEEVQGYPHRSAYRAQFVDPEGPQRSLAAGPGAELFGKVPRYSRDFVIATHAVAPPFGSDSATQEAHMRMGGGSGYARNNSFAYDLNARRGVREPAQSNYKTTFVGSAETAMAPLADGLVAPSWRSTNGYLRNGDSLPGVHAANEGAALHVARDFETSSQWAHHGSLEQAPAGPVIPVRALSRAGGGAGGSPSPSRRRAEHTGFSRSVLSPPALGLGSGHMALRLGAPEPQDAGLHHRSTRPHTVGFEAAPSRYHAAHASRVAPIAPRTGSGIEEAQELATLARLRTTDPLEFAHELSGAPRYRSTSSLLHNDKRQDEQDKALVAALGPYGSSGRGLSAGWGLRSPATEPAVSNGGVRNAYETTYERASAAARQTAHEVAVQGKTVGSALNQGTGYTANTVPTELEPQSQSPHSKTPAARARAAQETFALQSHIDFQHPAAHAAALPPARGFQINTLAPTQSAYAGSGGGGQIFARQHIRHTRARTHSLNAHRCPSTPC